MSEEQMNDSKFSRLFIIMIIAMTALTIILVVIAKFAAQDVNEKLDARSDIENTETLAERIAPVGSFSAETAVAAIEATATLSGQDVYNTKGCAACHASGVNNAPIYADAASWASRLSKGTDTFYNNAINGFQSMPAKGGNASLSDDDVKAAVDYMLKAL